MKKNGVLFILSAINYQDCLHSRVDIIDQIFAEQNQLILSVLENCHYPLKKLALSVFISLTDKISTLTNRYDNISSLFNSQEFNELLENWKDDENEEIQTADPDKVFEKYDCFHCYQILLLLIVMNMIWKKKNGRILI